MRVSTQIQDALEKDGDLGSYLAAILHGIPSFASFVFVGQMIVELLWTGKFSAREAAVLASGLPCAFVLAGAIPNILGFGKKRVNWRKTWQTLSRDWVVTGGFASLVWLLLSFPLAALLHSLQMPREPVSPGLVWAGAWSQLGWPLGVAALIFASSWIVGVRQK